MIHISTKKPFKTIISTHLHTNTGGAGDKTPVFYVLDRVKSLFDEGWVLIRGGFFHLLIDIYIRLQAGLEPSTLSVQKEKFSCTLPT